MEELDRGCYEKIKAKRRELGAKIDQAKKKENLEEELQALEDLIQLIRENTNAFDDSAIKLSVLECRFKMAEARKIFTTTGNLERIVSKCKEASQLSVPPSCPMLSQRSCSVIKEGSCKTFEYLYFSPDRKKELEFKLCFHRISHYSTALKFEAFSYMHGQVPNLQKSALVMQECFRLEEILLQFVKGTEEKEKRKKHLEYIQYWMSIFNEGFKLMEKDYDKALQELEVAIKLAKKSSIRFPNFFYDPTDLDNEQLFIEAARSFNSENFPEASKKLDEWLKKSPGLPKKAENTRFRYDNVTVRYLACNVLASLEQEQSRSISVRQAFAKLKKFAEGDVYLSPVSEALIKRIELLLEDYPNLYSTRMDEVKKHFPFHFDLSSLEKLLEDFHSTKHSELLPPDINNYFEPPEELHLSDALYVENKLEVYLEGLTNLFLHIADYNFQSYERYKALSELWICPLPAEFDSNFEKMSPEELICKIKIVGRCRGKKKEKWESSVEGILDSFQKFYKLLTDRRIKSAREMAERIIHDTIRYNWLPHTILVKQQRYNASEALYNIGAQRIWGDPYWQALEFEGLEPLEEGKYYFLRGEWNSRKIKSFKLRAHEYHHTYPSKYYQYIHTCATNYMKNPSFTDWICQFPREKRRWAHKLYGRFKCYTVEDVRILFQKIYTDLLPVTHKQGAYFFGLGGKLQAKSGPHMTVYFRQANPQVQHKVCTHILELSAESFNNVKVAVFLDDFTGTGSQAPKYLKKEIERSPWLKNIPLYLFFLAGFESAINEIKKNLSGLNIIINVAEKLPESHKAFSPGNGIFSYNSERQEAKEFFKEIALSFLPESKKSLALGYEDCQALVAFTWNTPNDTLPIFWACDRSFKDGKLKKPWVPLYPRYG